MTWLTFHKILWIFDWIIALFRLGHLTHKGPCQQNIWRTAWATIGSFWHKKFVQVVDDLINFWKNSVNILLNYLPFLTGILHSKVTLSAKYSSVFRESPPPPKPVYGGNFSHEAVTLKIRSKSPKSNKLLILSDLYRLANLVTFHPMSMK